MNAPDPRPPPASPSAPAAPDAPDAPGRLLSLLRFLARTCRAKARIDGFEACAMLSAHPTAAAQAYSDALLRVLAQGLGRAPVLHHPGAAEVSFDERWLAALIAAAARGDEDSLAFLTATRLPRPVARQVAWLARRIAERLGELERGGLN